MLEQFDTHTHAHTCTHTHTQTHTHIHKHTHTHTQTPTHTHTHTHIHTQLRDSMCCFLYPGFEHVTATRPFQPTATSATFALGRLSDSLSLQKRSAMSRKHLGEMSGSKSLDGRKKNKREMERLSSLGCVRREKVEVEGRNDGRREEGKVGEKADGETNIW